MLSWRAISDNWRGKAYPGYADPDESGDDPGDDGDDHDDGDEGGDDDDPNDPATDDC